MFRMRSEPGDGPKECLGTDIMESCWSHEESASPEFSRRSRRNARRNSIATPDLELTDSGSDEGKRFRGASCSTLLGQKRRKPILNARERNLRRLESNERERMRMHSLNDAFQVGKIKSLSTISISVIIFYLL